MTSFHKTLRIRRKTTVQTMLSKANVFVVGKRNVFLTLFLFKEKKKREKMNMPGLGQFRGWEIFEHFDCLGLRYCLLLLLRYFLLLLPTVT